MRIGVHIDKQLVKERGVVILSTDIQPFLANGDAEGGTQTEVPSFFLIEVIVDKHLPTAGHQIVIF